jgi:hypothetical protein
VRERLTADHVEGFATERTNVSASGIDRRP